MRLKRLFVWSGPSYSRFDGGGFLHISTADMPQGFESHSRGGGTRRSRRWLPQRKSGGRTRRSRTTTRPTPFVCWRWRWRRSERAPRRPRETAVPPRPLHLRPLGHQQPGTGHRYHHGHLREVPAACPGAGVPAAAARADPAQGVTYLDGRCRNFRPGQPIAGSPQRETSRVQS